MLHALLNEIPFYLDFEGEKYDTKPMGMSITGRILWKQGFFIC